MQTLWHKIWYDLWTHKVRTLLAMFSIAAGVFAVGAVFGMVDQLLTGMDRAHQTVTPSHFNIILRGSVDAATVEELRTTPGVAGIDPVNQVAVRYRTSAEGPWQQGNLVMRPDYNSQTYDVLTLREGAWPSDPDIGVERLSSQFFNLRQGESVTFDLGDEERSFPISGLIRHPFVQPPAFGGVAHFFADAPTLAAFGIPEGRFVQLLVRVAEPYSRERAEEVAGELRQRLGDLGVPVAVTIYQNPERHWGRGFVEGSMLVLQLMAATALFLSVVLVMNTLTALITQQTDQIGVLKAVGARRRHIIFAYLPGVLVYGLVALLLALPFGMLTAFYSTQSFLNLFNIDYDTFQFSPRAVALQVGAALLAPLLAGLWPVLRGAAISVREAIGSYGLGGDFGSNPFDRMIDRLGARLLPTAYAAALGNLFRRKGRLALTLLVMTTAGVTFLVIMSLVASMNATIDTDAAQRRYDLQIGFQTVQPTADISNVLVDALGITSSEQWISRNATILRAGERLEDSAGLGVQLIGMPIGSDFFQPILTGGRWLQPGDERVVVISQDTAEKNRLAIGDTITLNLGNLGSAEWQIIGTYRVVFSGGFATEGFYAPLPAVEAATGRSGEFSRLLLRTGDTSLAGAQAVADDLRARFEDANMQVDLYTSSVAEQDKIFARNQFDPVMSTLLGLASLLASVGGFGLASALSISVMERTREIGVLRAIGARTGTIMSLFMLEGTLQSLLSWLLAVPLAYMLAQPLAQQLGQTMLNANLDFAFNWAAVWVWLGVALGIGLMSSMQPAADAAKLSVRESLAYA
ncbi:MAG: ABC transporter permease [Chloroflexaceae bacterium]|jgi:putative ABC transport system permease protein|nr:ABC transporter permease [Chloroflexaceae bacterium]